MDDPPRRMNRNLRLANKYQLTNENKKNKYVCSGFTGIFHHYEDV